MIPIKFSVLRYIIHEYFILCVVKSESGKVYMVVNIYIPPSSSKHLNSDFIVILEQVNEAVE